MCSVMPSKLVSVSNHEMWVMSASSNDEDYDISPIESSEKIDIVEQAWENGEKGELSLRHLSFDRPTVQLLLKKLKDMYRRQREECEVTKTIQKVELYSCSFVDESCAIFFVQFLQRLGPQLQELFIVDTYRFNSPCSSDERAIAILQGLHHVPALERLAVDAADLKGVAVGEILRNLLCKCPKLSTLRLNDVEMDQGMWVPFLKGIQDHPAGLVHLDMDGWYLDDREFHMLVDTVLSSRSAQTLKSVNISFSDITEVSFSDITRLLQEMPSLRELILQNCDYLWRDTLVSSPGFQDFVQALKHTTKLEELRLGSCLPRDLGQIIARATTHLHAHDV